MKTFWIAVAALAIGFMTGIYVKELHIHSQIKGLCETHNAVGIGGVILRCPEKR